MKLQHFLLRFGTRSTQLVANVAGSRVPLYIVSEYPKCGGTWLAQMIAAYLRVPLPDKPMLPAVKSSVIHNHWGYSRRLFRPIYLVRDGRDLCISMFFHLVRTVKEGDPVRVGYIRKKMPDWFDRSVDCEGNPRFYSEFVDEWNASPLGVSTSWSQHVSNWMDRDGVCYIRYEDLLVAPEIELTRAVRFCAGLSSVDEARIAEVVRDFSFENQTGRRRGEADNFSFIRKGIAGDWTNYFNQESGRRFALHSGDTLKRLGYVANDDWWQELPK